MADSPPAPSTPPHTSAHVYASNGLEILQAATDAAEAIQSQQSHQPQQQHQLQHQQPQPPNPQSPNIQALQDVAAADHVSHEQQQHHNPQHQQSPSVTAAQAAVAAVAAQAAQAAARAAQDGISQTHDDVTNSFAQAPSIASSNGQAQTIGGPPAAGATSIQDPTINPKLTRLRRACDMCSMRKVKCDDTTIPCRPCRELGVDCTYHRETKRRGPPNKHAEAAKAAKRLRGEETSPAAVPGPSPPVATGFAITPPPPQTASKAVANIPTDGVLDGEAIAPMPVLELLIDDFFTYVHPLAPFPHEPTFRQALSNREDRTRPDFLALVASMVGALVASFPRSAREHLKTIHGNQVFPRPVVFVDKCRDVALLSRGAKWILKQPKTLDDAACSYFLGLASAYSYQWNASKHFMSETLTLIRELGFSRPALPGQLPLFGGDNYSHGDQPFNHVKDQIGKRIFWCLLLGVRSLSQTGSMQADVVIAPSTPSLPYPAYPENVDDLYILANEIIHHDADVAGNNMSLITGFRYAIDIYTTMNGIVSLELAYGMSTLPWADQRILIRDGLLAVKSIVDSLPAELQLLKNTPTDENGNATEGDALAELAESGIQYAPPVWPNAQPSHDLRNVLKIQPMRRKHLQYDMQKANVFVSQLATRSYFVDMYQSLRDVHMAEQAQHATATNGVTRQGEDGSAHDDDNNNNSNNNNSDDLEDTKPVLVDPDDAPIHELMTAERELIVQDLLAVLSHVPQRTLEPNGSSLVSKIRQIATTLLQGPTERKGAGELKATDALRSLVDVLIQLEKTGPAGPGGAAAAAATATAAVATSSSSSSSASSPLDRAGPHMTAQDEEVELRHWSELREWQLRFATQGA